VNVAGVNLFFCSVTRFAELRDALEKLQLNDAALKVNLYTDMLENIAFFVLGFRQGDIICIFLYMLSLSVVAYSTSL
jgi:translation elongation factor EF-4